MEVSSLSCGRNPCGVGPAYPSHYKMAFAFSILLYPHLLRLTLQLSYPYRGKVRIYHVPLEYLYGLGLAYLPVSLRLRQMSKKHLHLLTYFLVQACQYLWLAGIDDI